MENKEVKIESSMGERFDKSFTKQGIPIGIRIYLSKDGLDITPSKIKSFIKSEIDLAVAKERDNLLGKVIRNCRGFTEIGDKKLWEIDIEALEKDLITNNEVVKGKYTLIDDIPKWQNTDGTLEKYTHQDNNFSNMCSFVYCRCRN